MTPEARARSVKARAAALGFDACGIADARVPIDPGDKLGRWLSLGYHADMEWMRRSRATRRDPRLKLPGAKSVIVLARGYAHPDPPHPPGTGRVARYARGRDYHRALRKPLRALQEHLATLDPETESHASVDSGPVLERSWAERAGLGWIGKNSLVLRRDLGSWFFLATVIATIELAPDAPVEAHCGNCTACLDACPTEAIVEPGVVDSTRCISYHTIENRGAIPERLQAKFGGWVFGCDICQEVCPWNRFAPETSMADFLPREGTAPFPLDALDACEPAEFDARFAGSPLRRAKYAGMRRNIAIARRNADDSGTDSSNTRIAR